MSGKRSGIRWREDVGWEARCDSCAAKANTSSYWPLTPEFWHTNRMTMCRACLRARRNRADRARYRADLALQAKRQQASRAYRTDSGEVIRIKRRGRLAEDAMRSRLAYWRDPETARAKANAYYHRNRERILEKRRAAYRAKAA